MPRPATFIDWLSLLALSALWGSSFAVNEIALQSFSPAMLVAGRISTGFATIIYFRVVQGPGPTFLSLVSYLVPACAVIVGSVFLGESLAPSAYFGLVLILVGIALSELGTRLGSFQFPAVAGAKTLT